MNRRQFLMSSAAITLQSQISSGSPSVQAASTDSHQKLQSRLRNDPLRPQFHLLPQAGFVGDPCAPRFYEGQYHVFFHGSFGGRGWAHAMSKDLIHWTHMPLALPPGTGYDAYGTFTGGVLPGGEGASIVYTGVTKVPREQETIRNEGLREVQCIATSMDKDLRTWKKREKPIIEGPPPGIYVTGFRDPFGWKDGDTWYVLVGSGFPQVGGAVLLYRSHDMEHWEYVHPLAQGRWNEQSFSNPVPSGEMWECPDFFALGEKHVLLYSTEHATWWEVGSFDKAELRFHCEKRGILDHGAYYAPRSMVDGTGRRILWGWVQETRDAALIKQAGWAGCISLPRVLTLSPGNGLQINVAPEIVSLRQLRLEIKTPHEMQGISDQLMRTPIQNRRGSILCTFEAGTTPCSLTLQLRTTAEPVTIFSLTYSQTTGAPFIAIGDRLIPAHPDAAGFITLQIWVDGSVIETFIDQHQAMTTRSYEAPNQPGEIYILWAGSLSVLKNLSIFDVDPISADRLST